MTTYRWTNTGPSIGRFQINVDDRTFRQRERCVVLVRRARTHNGFVGMNASNSRFFVLDSNIRRYRLALGFFLWFAAYDTWPIDCDCRHLRRNN